MVITNPAVLLLSWKFNLILLCPRPVGGAGALSGHRRPSSVRLSDVSYIGSNSKTKRPRKTKLCTGVSNPGHMRLPHRLQGQKVKSQGHGAGAYCGGHLAAQLVVCTIVGGKFFHVM